MEPESQTLPINYIKLLINKIKGKQIVLFLDYVIESINMIEISTNFQVEQIVTRTMKDPDTLSHSQLYQFIYIEISGNSRYVTIYLYLYRTYERNVTIYNSNK